MSSPADEQDFPGHLLHQAALWDNEELLLDLLNGELLSHIDSVDAWGRTALHAAATTDNSKCLDILLRAGADPNIASGAQDNFKTPLHKASEHGFLSNVQLLIEAGANPEKCEGQGYTGVDLAERGGHVSTFEYLKKAEISKEEARENLHCTIRDAVSKGDVPRVKFLMRDAGKTTPGVESIINFTPNGTNSLLFKACEIGNKELVKILLDAGADGRIHSVTKYSPLYIACYSGYKDIVTLLLKKFPLLVQVPTVEKWLPLHACCINGHAGILEMLLNFDYPQDMLITLRHFSGDWEYEMAFDINTKDVSGQNALYIACQMGNQRLIDTLLKYRVEVRKLGEQRPPSSSTTIQPSESEQNFADNNLTKNTSPNKRRVSEGIQGIISKLSLVTNQNLSSSKRLENLLSPVDVNAYCEDFQTPLHVVVKQRNHAIATMLLNAKADPNLPILPSPHNNNGTLNRRGSKNSAEQQRLLLKPKKDEASTALLEACLHRDLGMIELLLKHGARDDDCKAISVISHDDIIVGKILALKAHQDSENKINTSYINDYILLNLKKTVLTSSIFPTCAVNINWHNQKLDRICEKWLINAALRINPRLRLCPNTRNQNLGLQAITKLDLSSNFLKSPGNIWSLCSLKHLNLSHNKLIDLGNSPISSPSLEELLLQDNELETLPDELFSLPIITLDVSNNRLQGVPSTVWKSSRLQELNVSLNLLTDLPTFSSSGGMMELSVFDSLPYDQSLSSSLLSSPIDEQPSTKDTDFIMVDFQKNRERLVRGSASSTDQQQLLDPQHSAVLTHHAFWRENINIVKNQELAEKSSSTIESSLLNLNLAHNSFHKIPKVLACLAPNLQRLNLSYNNLKFMGHIGEYPAGIKQLDLSNNRIERWFYSPSSSSSDKKTSSIKLFCYGCILDSVNEVEAGEERCVHKRHIRLEHLKTLLLGGNFLKNILVHGEGEGGGEETTSSSAAVLDSGRKSSSGKSLWFPSITMIDLAMNKLEEVTAKVAELTSLSVLNLSGNGEITDLPPEMGLLNRMWNLNVTGTNLQEPLKSMIESKRCKTMDIIGYLKSVLEDAKPYSRMKLMVVGIQGIGKTTLLHQLRQEGSQRHATQDHWARRMGAANKMALQKSGKPISTVGVDIGSWVIEPKGTRNNNFGPVQFRTWDFGGQKEYYATHVYFLSKRSLYLIVWNICDGEKGLNEIMLWLINIQARAPNSPCIIVGTHFDLVSDKFPPGYLDYLQQKIKDRFIFITDPEKRGLPKVLCSVEISCKTRHNIRHLSSLIYEAVFNIKTSTGKRLLEQRIPSKYINLEEIVAYLATDRKNNKLDPVLSDKEFKAQAAEWLDKGFGLTFRDDAEIMQACTFLHENGVLLHYEDSTLRDLYFLDPQWLCDMLAHVVTVREINPFAKNGVMKVDDLLHLFKGQSTETRDYIMSLLSKFELAVPFDNIRLLIPSLLPSLEQMKIGQNEVRVRVPMRSRGWALKKTVNRMNRHVSIDSNLSGGGSISSPTTSPIHSQSGYDLASASSSSSEVLADTTTTTTKFYTIEKGEIPSINRFLLLSYFPSGLWPRLISRILSDDRIVEIIRNYFNPHHSTDITPEVVKVLDQQAEWCCWQTGMELRYGDLVVMRIKEVTGEKPFTFMLRRDDGALCESDVCDEISNPSVPSAAAVSREAEENNSEQVWDAVDLTETNLLEIHIPTRRIIVKSSIITTDNNSTSSQRRNLSSADPASFRLITLEPCMESIAKLLALTVDHVDCLLEDWYPSIGTRFVHTSEGKYLVTRLIPCPHCFPSENEAQDPHNDTSSSSVAGKENEKSWPSTSPGGGARPDLFKMFGFGIGGNNKSPRMSSDSGVGNSPTNTRVSSVDSNPSHAGQDANNELLEVETTIMPGGILLKTGNRIEGGGGINRESFTSGLNYFLRGSGSYGNNGKKQVALYSWSVEYCILHGQKSFEIDATINNVDEDSSSGGGDAEKPFHHHRKIETFGVKCPKHGDVSLSEIAPDILFLDLNSRYLLNNTDIQRGKLLGRGAFGFVFGGTLTQKYDSKPMDVAIKTFQPIDPGCENNEAQVAYKLARNKWFRAPAQSSTRAYVAARGEVRVLYWVAHPNVVPFIGLCQSPLSIIMPRAPRGALDIVLSDYKRSGDKVKEETARVTILQVGKALEYLHSHRIIYRDLKSENVLVWTFPQPFAKIDDVTNVDVKLADYGISRASFPTGSKGFGGTEGFMAPEIIRYNGEEEYTEKVDIFSFGMMIYELISLRQPFDGCENVKESILEGMRPSLAQRDCDFYPLYLLDLMAVCWSHASKDRPSATQIVSIASAPEFTIIRDVVSLGSVTNVVAGLGLQYGDDREIWASCSTGGIYCLKVKTLNNIDSCHQFEFVAGVVTAMCPVDDTVWMGDTMGKIHILKISDYSKTLECDYESLVGYVGAVVSVKFLCSVVAVAFSSGRLFLCDKTTSHPLTELGKTPVIHCLSCRSIEDGQMELWTGEKAGQMTVYTIKDSLVISQETINHYEPKIDAVEVLLVEGHANQELLFSYVYPGSVIYGWDCNRREMISRLDVGKLLPVKESMEEELNHKPLQVTVLRASLNEVYVGTNRGFVFLADIKRLRPITFFRPFEQDVRSFWIFKNNSSKFCGSLGNLSSESKDNNDIIIPTTTIHSSTSSSNISDGKSNSGGGGGDTDIRGISPTPSSSQGEEKHNSMQIVIGIGKGFSNLIEKSVGVVPTGPEQIRHRRKAYAMLWHIPSHFS